MSDHAIPAGSRSQHDRQRTEAFRFVLRRETRAQHEALDSNRPFAELMAGSLTLDGYRRLMALFHGYYAAYDPALERAVQQYRFEAEGFAYQARTPILARDLKDLGVGGPEIGMPATPSFASPAAMTGALYVLEGSLLGGSTLHAATETVLARDHARGNAYWQWCKECAGQRWSMTCRLLEALSQDPDAREVMISSARETFDGFAAWLEQWNGTREMSENGRR